jgi:hypothetical protein
MAQAGPSVADMTHALRGISFPAKKQDLKQQAQSNNAPDEVISAIEHLPEEEFGTMAEVARAYGEEGPGKVSGGQHEQSTEQARKGGSRSRSGQ